MPPADDGAPAAPVEALAAPADAETVLLVPPIEVEVVDPDWLVRKLVVASLAATEREEAR